MIFLTESQRIARPGYNKSGRHTKTDFFKKLAYCTVSNQLTCFQRRPTIRVRISVISHFFIIAGLLLSVFNIQESHADKRYSKERFLGDEKTPWEITAKSLFYNEKEGLYLAEGDVVISRGDQMLYAQRATYDIRTGMAGVSGNVRFESGGDIFTGDQGVFDLKNQTGRIENARVFLSKNNYYVSGKVMEKISKDSYIVKGCRLTTCDGVNPAWSITGSEVKVTIEGYGTVKHAAFWVRGIPLFYFPYMIFPAKTKRQTGLLPPRLGYSSRNGIDVELPLFLALSDQTDATLYQRYIEKRGYMQGAEFRYVTSENSKGVFLFDILADKKKVKDMNDLDDISLSPFPRTNEIRYWLRSRADQKVSKGLSLSLDIDYVSDQDYFPDLETSLYGYQARPALSRETGRGLEERHSPTRRSAVRLSHNGEGYSMQGLGSYHQRPENPSYDTTPQPAGGFDYLFLPHKIKGLPTFLNFEADYDYVWREAGQRGHRASIDPELRLPFWLGPYLELEPSIRYTHAAQWLEDNPERDDFQEKSAYEAGGRLSTNFERVYGYNGETVKKLKHKIVPFFSYKYRNHLLEKEYRPWFEPIEHEEDANVVAFSLENYLDARLENGKGDVTYRQFCFMSFTQGYDFHELRRDLDPGIQRQPWMPLKGLLLVRPFGNLDIYGEAEWDHYDSDVTTADTSMEISWARGGGRRDTIKGSYIFDKGGQKTLKASGTLNLIGGFSAGGSLERDLELDHSISNSYWAGYDSQCWGLRLMATRTDDETTMALIFRLINFADIKAF